MEGNMPLFEVKEKTILKQTLREKYVVPPFSILDAKSGQWMKRKHEWEDILQDRTNNVRNIVAKGNTPYCNAYADDTYYGLKSVGTISTFDPFLCEILVRWFSKEGMNVIDPFAGGVVRGAVSTLLNRHYDGIDISENQVRHNIEQWKIIADRYDLNEYPVYHLGDAENALDNFQRNYFDMLLTCPPYYNLERYTDESEDLSNKETYGEFLDKYALIIDKCYNVLKENSFAVIVVEEIRDKDGILYGFVPDTINIFQQMGFKYYNEMILENRVVSLKVRCPKYFDQSRKVGRHHQNVLVFYKGDTDAITEKFGTFNIKE